MIHGDKEYESGEIKTPDINAIMQANNLYVYVLNNPVMFEDSSGLAAGDKFKSSADAAKDWANTYYSESYYVGFECASLIYFSEDAEGNIYYSYTEITWGDAHSVAPGNAYKFLPNDAVAFAVIHSHPNSPDFSSADKNFATSNYMSIFVVTKSSKGVNIKKWGDTRRGFAESIIATNYNVRQLSNIRKRVLETQFKEKWEMHIKNGCANGFGCEHKSWPRN